MRVMAGAMALLLAAACDQTAAPVADTRQAVRLPQEMCDKAGDNIAALEERAVIDQDGNGAATIFHDVWLQLPQPQREEIANALGVVAACAAPEPIVEKEVVINSETGTVLMRRTVPLAVDPSLLLEE